jgi:hypothetical protein
LYPLCFFPICFWNEFAVFCFLFFSQFHWQIFGECVLTILERMCLDPFYVVGSNQPFFREPFFDVFNSSFINKLVDNKVNFMIFGIVFCLIIIRLWIGFYKLGEFGKRSGR